LDVQSGTLNAAVSYQLDETAAFSNTGLGTEPATLSGDESITLAFTPVPEPVSAMMLPGLAIAARRRPVRRRKS
jgi:hypothetical protein